MRCRRVVDYYLVPIVSSCAKVKRRGEARFSTKLPYVALCCCSMVFMSPPSENHQAALERADELFAVDNGAQVRAARVLLGVSQSALARSARLSLSTLNDLEHGRGSVRRRTREQVARCLEDAGIVFVRESAAVEGRLLGVLLRREERPENVSETAQRWLDPDSLVRPLELLFFVASEHPHPAPNETLRLGVRLLFPHRTVLFDLTGFDLSALRLAALSRFLLSAFSLYSDRLLCTDPLRLPTLAVSNAAAHEMLERSATRPLLDPFPLLDLLTRSDERAAATLATCLRQNDHPLARVRHLVEAQLDA